MLSRSARKRLATRALVALLLGVLAGWILIAFATRVGPAETHERAAAAETPAEVVPPRTPLDLEGEAERSAAADASTETSSDVPASDASATSVDTEVRVRVELVETGGAPVGAGTCLAVPIEGSGAPAPSERWKRAGSDAKGVAVVEGLAPGRHVVTIAAPSRAARRFDLALAPGTNDLGRVEFPPLEAPSDVRVRLAGVPPGAMPPKGVLHLWSLDGGDVDRWISIARPSWIRADAHVDPVATFTKVPHGRCMLAFLREDRFDAPLFREVDVPTVEVVIELDDAGALPLHVRATDSSGELVEARIVLLSDRHARPRVATVTGGDAIVASEPSGERAAWRWVLLAKDRKPVQGTSADFQRRRSTLVEGDELYLEARLEPGLGVLVVARDADPTIAAPLASGEAEIVSDHLPALEGVDVSVAGKTLATTDADGFAIVTLARADAILEIGSARFAVVGSTNLESGVVKRIDEPVLVRCASRR